MSAIERIYIIGFMGAGKSTFGKKLATLLGWSFIDLDQYLENKRGMSISRQFEIDGEFRFRTAESEALREIRQSHVVLATGGGTPCFDENMEWMQQHGFTVYLELPPAALASRILPEKAKRPLVSGIPDKDLEKFITEKLAKRREYYVRARLILNGLHPDFDEVINRVKTG